jgi:hypothetical protein
MYCTGEKLFAAIYLPSLRWASESIKIISVNPEAILSLLLGQLLTAALRQLTVDSQFPPQ